MKIHVIFWIMILYSDGGYYHLRGPCSLHLQVEVKVAGNGKKV